MYFILQTKNKILHFIFVANSQLKSNPMTNVSRYTLTVIFLCFIYNLWCQDYIPVVINGEAFFRTELETSDGILAAEVTVANFEKIDGQLFNRVFFKRGFGADELVGYLREDPGTGSIFLRTVDNPQEWLVMDLSLEVGDMISLSARWCDGQPGSIATVIAVNDIDGLREIVFDREVGDTEFCEQLRFLESVGPNATLIFPFFRDAIAENGTAQRICHASHENIIYYPADSDVDFCGDAITSTETPNNISIQLFPNPAYDQFRVKGLAPESWFRIFDGQGKTLGIFTATQTINCANWPSGMYHLQLLSTNKKEIARILKL